MATQQLAWSPAATVTADTDVNGLITAVHLSVNPGYAVTVDATAGPRSKTVGPIDNTQGSAPITQSWTLPQPFNPDQPFGITVR